MTSPKHPRADPDDVRSLAPGLRARAERPAEARIPRGRAHPAGARRRAGAGDAA